MKREKTPRSWPIFLLIIVAVACFFLAGFQNAGNTGTQTTLKQVFFAANAPLISTVVIPNIGASSHWLMYCISGSVSSLNIQLEGSNDLTRYSAISHVGTQTAPGCYILQSAGYFAALRGRITAFGGAGGTVDAYYTGSSGPTSGNFPGDSLQVQGAPVATGLFGNVPVIESGQTGNPQTTNAIAGIAAIELSGSIPTKNANAIYNLSAYCSTGTATLQICQASGSCTAASSYTVPVGTTLQNLSFPTPIVAQPHGPLRAELSSCGGGNTGTLNMVSGQVQVLP